MSNSPQEDRGGLSPEWWTKIDRLLGPTAEESKQEPPHLAKKASITCSMNSPRRHMDDNGNPCHVHEWERDK